MTAVDSLCRGIDIIYNICSDDILCAIHEACSFMQQRAGNLSMRKHDRTAHDRPDWIRIHDTLSYAWQKESRLTALEFIVEVD